MTTVIMQDMKAVSANGLCNKGGRKFFKKHSLDWSKFLRTGVDAEVLLALDDEIVNRVVRAAERRELGESLGQ